MRWLRSTSLTSQENDVVSQTEIARVNKNWLRLDDPDDLLHLEKDRKRILIEAVSRTSRKHG